MVFRLRADERIARLRRVSYLAELPGSDLAAIAERMVEEEVPAGSVLTREGQRGGVAYVIVTGEASVTSGGRELARLGAGQVVGELSLLDRKPRTATVTALTDLQVVAVSADDFHALLQRIPHLAMQLLGVLAARIRTLDAQVVAGL